MPAERISMRKIREVLRLKHDCHLGERKIATSCGLSKSTVNRYLQRTQVLGLSWPLPDDLDDESLERKLFPDERQLQYTLPDWREVHREIKRAGVTLFLLWEEYKSCDPSGLCYSRFCDLYRQFKTCVDPVMRQTYKAGEKLLLDYAGMTVPWTEASTGEIFQAQIFVATLGASSYTFVEATRSQQLPDWIGAHVRAFEFFGGVPEILTPDNLKSGITKAHRYDPDINPTYQDMANYYGVAVVPARVRTPQDKAKVEAAVCFVETFILAKFRNRTFFSVCEINTAIKVLLTALNAKAFQKLPGSRLSEFNELDKPALKALPETRYEYADWKKVRAGIDYHVSFEYHYYSVPYQYLKHELNLRITRTTLQCYYKDKLIATHVRVYRKGHTTIKEHMPKSHQQYAEWTPERLTRWARQSGEATAELIQSMIDARPHPQQAFKSCLGVMRLGKHHGKDRLEKAAARALALGTLSYQSIDSILKYGLEDKPLPQASNSTQEPLVHEHVRGGDYYC